MKGLQSPREWLVKMFIIRRRRSCWQAARVFKDEGILSAYHVPGALCTPYLISAIAQGVDGSFPCLPNEEIKAQ